MNIKLSEEKIRILKEEGTHFKDAIDGRMYYQYPREVYKETDNEFIFELVDKVLEPIELPSDEELAILFHNKYEELAPKFKYETKIETKKFNKDSNNGKLMIAVCKQILEILNQNK